MFMLLQGQIILAMTIAKGNNLVGIPLLLITSAITLTYAVRMKLIKPKRFCNWAVWAYGIGGVIVTFALSIVINLIILKLTHQIKTPDNQEALVKGIAANPLGFALYACLIAPVIEELYYRKTIPDWWYSAIRQIKGKTTNPSDQEIIVPETNNITNTVAGFAYLIGTVSFINAHNPGDIASWLVYGVLAASFLTIRIKKGIEASLITHIIWNTIAMVPLLVA